MITKIAVGAMDAVKATMTAQLVVNVMGLALNHMNQKQINAMTLTNWPFPPATGAVPWTAKQIKEYAKQQRDQAGDALL